MTSRTPHKASALLPVGALALIALASASALADPVTLPVQGELRDSLGVAIDGVAVVEFGLFPTPTGGTAVYSETRVDLYATAGFFTTMLGQDGTLDSSLFETWPSLWIGVTVNGFPLTPRLPLGTLPHAAWAFRAAEADVATVADEVQWANVTGRPGFTYSGTDGVVVNAGVLELDWGTSSVCTGGTYVLGVDRFGSAICSSDLLLGPPGPEGEPGPIGPIGPTGPTGPIGLMGPQGPIGVVGPVGPTGPRGETGPQGLTGPQGPQGPQGAQGPTGPAGPIGATGPVGAIGPVGPTGPQGAAGPAGSQGPQGPLGPQGERGPQGPQGPAGLRGPTGATGAAGPAGPAGPQGNTGPQGAQGAAGPRGPDGPQGATGPQGTQGPRGAQGPQGAAGPAGPAGGTGTQGPQGPTTLDGLENGACFVRNFTNPCPTYFTSQGYWDFGAYSGLHYVCCR